MEILNRLKERRVPLIVLGVFAFELIFPHYTYAADAKSSVVLPKLTYKSAETSQKMAYQPTENGRNVLVRLDGIKKTSTEEIAEISQEMAKGDEVALAAPVKAYNVKKTYKIPMSAYNSEPAQTDGDPCTTASGYNVCKANEENVIAANFLPLGTKVRIPELFGDRVFTVEDRMNKRYYLKADIWMKNRTDAIKFGVKYSTLEVLE